MKYAWIANERDSWPVTLMCEALEVSRSGYHAWAARKPSARDLEDERLAVEIRAIYAANDANYGAPRITRELRAQGWEVNEKRVTRMMRAQGLAAKQRRKFKATTDSKHNLPVAANLLEQDFTSAQAPNRVWLADITYVWTAEGWLYLAAVLDLYTRKLVGWSMAERMTQQLALEALTMAYWREKPAPGLIHHSDRGAQYCSHAYRERLAGYKMSASMSRKGNCWDNAPMESLNHSLKVERVNARRYETRAQARSDVFDWIECYYNVRRRHSALGYLSPREFARAYKTDEHRAA